MTATMTPTWWGQQAQEFADDYGLLLVVINHPQLAEPLNIVSADLDITSTRGGATPELYQGWPLGIRLPSQGDEQARGGIRLGNVDHRIGRTVRGLRGTIEISFYIVSRENPDDLIYDHEGLKVSGVRSDGPWIMVDVVGQGAHGMAFPKSSGTPDITPGIFVA